MRGQWRKKKKKNTSFNSRREGGSPAVKFCPQRSYRVDYTSFYYIQPNQTETSRSLRLRRLLLQLEQARNLSSLYVARAKHFCKRNFSLIFPITRESLYSILITTFAILNYSVTSSTRNSFSLAPIGKVGERDRAHILFHDWKFSAPGSLHVNENSVVHLRILRFCEGRAATNGSYNFDFFFVYTGYLQPKTYVCIQKKKKKNKLHFD